MQKWLVVLLALTALTCFVGGCVPGNGYCFHAEFSPDSKKFGALWIENYYGVQFNPGGPNPKSTTLLVRYAAVSDPANTRQVKIATRDGFGMTSASQMRWSPGSRYIAVACLGKLWCVDTQTGQAQPCSPQTVSVTSFSWSGPADLVYTSFPVSAKPDDHACDVFRQTVMAPVTAAVRIATIDRYRDNEEQYIPGNDVGRRDVWSPAGRYLIYTDGQFQSGNINMLDLQDGVTTKLLTGRPFPRSMTLVGGLNEAVSWKMDESEAALLIYRQAKPEFLHVRPATKQVSDLSRLFLPIAGKDRCTPPPLWTADGLYVLYTSADAWMLIQPDPWKVTNIPGFTGLKTSLDLVQYVPHAPWVRTNQTIRDYQGRTITTLSDSNQVLSPDGRWIGEWPRSSKTPTITPIVTSK